MKENQVNQCKYCVTDKVMTPLCHMQRYEMLQYFLKG